MSSLASAHACGATSCAATGCTPAASTSASPAAARPKASTLVTGRVRRTRGRRIGDFDDHAPLDAVIATIGYVQVALTVDDDAVVVEELAGVLAVEDAALACCATGWV